MFLVVAVGLVSEKIFVYSYHNTVQEADTAANRSRECISLHDFEIVDCCDVPLRQWNAHVDQIVRSRRFSTPHNNQSSNSQSSNNNQFPTSARQFNEGCA